MNQMETAADFDSISLSNHSTLLNVDANGDDASEKSGVISINDERNKYYQFYKKAAKSRSSRQ